MQTFSVIQNKYGGFIDICEYNGFLYAIQNSGQFLSGRLCVFDEKLNLISFCENIGDARQIKISNGIAVISARINGLWIFDVNNIQPIKLAHYQTIEFATGITIYSNIVFVSCRQYGVEIVDISDPKRPTYKGVLSMGEVQSTFVYNNVLYGGLWGDMKVIAFDIKDINKPQKIFDIELHGRGDGVVVRDNFLYAVSGQHGKGIKNFSDESDPQFGNGNGVSVFDLSQNCKEVFYDNFGKGYFIHIDTWKPVLCGDILICCDSAMGVHIYNASSFEKICEIKISEFNNKIDAVTSAISLKNKLYITTAYGGIYQYSDLCFDETYNPECNEFIFAEKQRFSFTCNKKISLKQLYSGDFSVLKICKIRGHYALACGGDGLHIVDEKFNLICKVMQEGFCCDVKVSDDFVVGAFSENGVCIYKLEKDLLKLISSYKLKSAVQQISISDSGNYIACCAGSAEVIMLDISDKFNIKEIFSRKAKQGPLYGENFVSKNLSDGTMLMFWHRDGVIYSNPDNGG